MLQFLLMSSTWSMNLGLLILRIGIGLILMRHGINKIFGGTETLQSVGSTMHIIGLSFAPLLWGILIACIELGGGFLFALGLWTRFAAFMVGCIMVVAYSMHTIKGDPFTIASYPLAILTIMISVLVAGAGALSVDHILIRQASAPEKNTEVKNLL